jgi:5-dehydro-2-deoxygluconokinase
MIGSTEAVVMGRVGADLYPSPEHLRTPLRQIDRYDRYAGGFAANVATGLARLGVRTAVVSRVGDDGHGEFVREFLANEGVDVRWLATDPDLRTALAFCEIWPPDRFPITFYRTPTCPDWRLSLSDLDIQEVAAAPILFGTGTALARSPSRETTMAVLRAHTGTTVFDLDYRPMLWEDHEAYPREAREAWSAADIVVGNGEELLAATAADDEGNAVKDVLSSGPSLVVAKRGGWGAATYDEAGMNEVPGIHVEVVNGLGAGDAFAAAFGHGLLRGLSPVEAARRGNAAGAIVASAIPCSAAMPTLEAIEELLAGASG